MTDTRRDATRLKALIADDEPRARQFLEKLLGEHADVEVVGMARGGAEALEMIGALKPDVVFLDIHMPDLSGLEVARHLKGDALAGGGVRDRVRSSTRSRRSRSRRSTTC